MKPLLQNYKSIERYVHISFDDILNKCTQEIAELIEAIVKNDTIETQKEAADSLVNILSVSQELGILEENYSPKSTSPLELAINSGKWNSDINALRNRYSKSPKNLSEVRVSTKILVENILNFTDKTKTVEQILQESIQKFESRKELYKPDINLKDYISSYEDFPKVGINFKDISPLIAHQKALEYAVFEMAESCRGADVIVGLDARGFIFGSLIAKNLNKPFVMIRKKGKLPGITHSVSYGLEYGKDTIEIQQGSILPWQKVALIDDILATGGSIQAAIDLVEKSQWVVHNLSFIIALNEDELKKFPSRKALEKYSSHALISYND